MKNERSLHFMRQYIQPSQFSTQRVEYHPPQLINITPRPCQYA